MHSTMIWRNKIIKSISDTVWSSLNLSTFDKDALATALNNLILDSNFSRNLILQNDGTVAMFPNGVSYSSVIRVDLSLSCLVPAYWWTPDKPLHPSRHQFSIRGDKDISSS